MKGCFVCGGDGGVGFMDKDHTWRSGSCASPMGCMDCFSDHDASPPTSSDWTASPVACMKLNAEDCPASTGTPDPYG